MNAPPRPPPRPPPPLEELGGTTLAELELPPIAASLPAPFGVPIRSVPVPSLAPDGVPGVLTGPPGTQLTIPGLPPSVRGWIHAHALHLLILAVATGLTIARVAPPAFFYSVVSLLIGVELPTPRGAAERPIVLATVPPASSASASSSSTDGRGPLR